MSMVLAHGEILFYEKGAVYQVFGLKLGTLKCVRNLDFKRLLAISLTFLSYLLQIYLLLRLPNLAVICVTSEGVSAQIVI